MNADASFVKHLSRPMVLPPPPDHDASSPADDAWSWKSVPAYGSQLCSKQDTCDLPKLAVEKSSEQGRNDDGHDTDTHRGLGGTFEFAWQQDV